MTPQGSAVELDGEPFVPEAAALLATTEFNESVEFSEDSAEVTVTGRADDGTVIELTYALSQIMVAVAEYDDPESATWTTEPANVERVQAYGDDPDDDPDALKFHVEGEEVTWTGNDPETHIEAHNRAADTSFEEDYFVATGFDDADPVPNQYDAYWIVTLAETEDGDELYRHTEYEEGA